MDREEPVNRLEVTNDLLLRLYVFCCTSRCKQLP